MSNLKNLLSAGDLNRDFAIHLLDVAEGMAEGEFAKTPRELLREALAAQQLDAAETMLAIGSGTGPDTLADLLLQFSDDDRLSAFNWLLRHGAPARAHRPHPRRPGNGQAATHRNGGPSREDLVVRALHLVHDPAVQDPRGLDAVA